MKQNTIKLIDNILKPSREFTPIPFWFLNDELTEEKIKSQLTDFKSKGVDGVVLHPRIGICNDMKYMSEKFLDKIEFAVDISKQLDMYIVLYDEGMYPSGSANGQVVSVNPAFASIGLTLTDNSDGGKIIASFDDGMHLVQKHSGGTIRGIHFGEDDGEENAPPSADILNPQAVDTFISLTHEKYYNRLGKYFGNVIIGFFTDEPSVLGRNVSGFIDWTDGLEKEIISSGGDMQELRDLFEGHSNKSTQIYKRVVHKRLCDTYYKRLSQWCDEHSISLMGHPEGADDIDEECYFHIPGQDLVFRWVSPEDEGLIGTQSVQAKCSSDAARHTNKRRNSNECFGVCSRDQIPWYFTADDMKWFIDWLGVRGVNMFIPHAFYYSVDGERSGERPPDVGPNNIWWGHYSLFSTYMKRISYIMTDSKNAARVCVLCESKNMPVEKVKPFYENQIEFNYLSKSLLSDCLVRDNKLCIAEYEYEQILCDDKLGLDVDQICDYCGVSWHDFKTDVPCPSLRVSHIIKENTHMYFVANQGDENISTNVSVNEQGTPIFMNMWTGKYGGVQLENENGKTSFKLNLKRHESILIIIDTENEHIKPYYTKKTFLDINISVKNTCTENITKEYTAVVDVVEVLGYEHVVVTGEEMIECYCNDDFVGVSFWNAHEFFVAPYLKKGKNVLRFVATGSIANFYSKNDIEYGLEI